MTTTITKARKKAFVGDRLSCCSVTESGPDIPCLSDMTKDEFCVLLSARIKNAYKSTGIPAEIAFAGLSEEYGINL